MTVYKTKYYLISMSEKRPVVHTKHGNFKTEHAAFEFTTHRIALTPNQFLIELKPDFYGVFPMLGKRILQCRAGYTVEGATPYEEQARREEGEH